MSSDFGPAMWGLLGTLVGAAASVGTTWINNANVSRLELQRARELRAETARAFQRKTLLDLQDALADLMRHASVAVLNDLKEGAEGVEWKSIMLNQAQAEALRTAFRSVFTLKQRVSNDLLRGQIHKFTTDVAEAVNAESQSSATLLWVYVLNEQDALAAQVGEVLRSHYEHN